MSFNMFQNSFFFVNENEIDNNFNFGIVFLVFQKNKMQIGNAITFGILVYHWLFHNLRKTRFFIELYPPSQEET